ncbi:MAG: hypothetical protein ABI681_07745 [Gemmatimonadales bacterium]
MRCERHFEGASILSEFYQLRRTAIKDFSAYLGFLAGFIGAAPFAWTLLAAQLESGTFVRGLWYFFGLVLAAGIFTGIAGLGIGYAAGLLWEQFHRHRRRERLRGKALSEALDGETPDEAPPDDTPAPARVPLLQLVPRHLPEVPNVTGRRLASVRFLARSIELDFSLLKVEVGGSPLVVCAGQGFRYPELGSRDALCGLVGARVETMRFVDESVELAFDSGCDLILARAAVAVA